jgi:hypothetical protein
VLALPALRRLLPALAAAFALAAPAAALASPSAVINDCSSHGRLTKSYSQSDYAGALRNIPTDLDEYTDCRDVIRRAQLGAAGGGGSSGGGSGPGQTGAGGGGTGTPTGPGGAAGGGTGGATPGEANPGHSADEALAQATPSERRAIERARGAADAPVRLGGRIVRPGELGFQGTGLLNTLPTPLVVVLVLLALGACAGGGLLMKARVVARRSRP